MRKHFVITLLFIITCWSVFAEPLILDRDICLKLAEQNNPELMNSLISLKTSQREADSSWNAFLPSFPASLRMSSGGTVSDFSESGISVNASIGAGYSFIPGIGETLRQLQMAAENSNLSHENLRRTLLFSVESEFYYLLAAESNLEIQKSNIELAEKLYEQTKIRFQNGLAPELDVLQAHVNAANLVPKYTSLESAYKARLKEFLLVLGVDPMTEVSLSGSIEINYAELDTESLIAAHLLNRPDVKSQHRKMEMLNSTLRQTKLNSYIPSVSVSASISQRILDTSEDNSWSSSSDPSASIGLGVSLGFEDYIPGSSVYLKIKAIEDSIEKEALNLDTITQEARLEIVNLINALQADRENLELSALNLTLSESSYKMTEISFSNGKSSRLNLDDAQQDLLIARQNLLESKYQYKKDLINLKRALGFDINETF